MIRKHIPFASFGTNPSVGFAAGAGARRYGALSLSADGFVYNRSPIKGKAPELSLYYQLGSKIWDLEDIKTCGASFIKAFVEFVQS